MARNCTYSDPAGRHAAAGAWARPITPIPSPRSTGRDRIPIANRGSAARRSAP